MMSDVLEVITADTASLLSGVAQVDKMCDNPFVSLGEDADQQENNETSQVTVNYECVDRQLQYVEYSALRISLQHTVSTCLTHMPDSNDSPGLYRGRCSFHSASHWVQHLVKGGVYQGNTITMPMTAAPSHTFHAILYGLPLTTACFNYFFKHHQIPQQSFHKRSQ